jgi:hypothetical protein
VNPPPYPPRNKYQIVLLQVCLANLMLGRLLELMLSSSTQGTLRGMFFRVEAGDPRTTFTAVLGNASHSALIV